MPTFRPDPNSVVDYLKSTGGASDYGSRKQQAQGMGIDGYRGTAQQNMQLMELLKAHAEQQQANANQQQQQANANYENINPAPLSEVAPQSIPYILPKTHEQGLEFTTNPHVEPGYDQQQWDLPRRLVLDQKGKNGTTWGYGLNNNVSMGASRYLHDKPIHVPELSWENGGIPGVNYDAGVSKNRRYFPKRDK
jgi:hypothetical protein